MTIFETVPPKPGKSISFDFQCPKGHSAMNDAGGAEVVDLKDYDVSKLKTVRL